MRVTKKPSGGVIFFFRCKSCNFFFPAVNACNKKTVRWCNFFFFAVSRVSRLTRLTAGKKKLHDYTVFLLRAFTAKKKKLHELQHTLLQGVGHQISCLGVCYANDLKKGGIRRPRLRLI